MRRKYRIDKRRDPSARDARAGARNCSAGRFEEQKRDMTGFGRIARDFGSKTQVIELWPLPTTAPVDVVRSTAPNTASEVALAPAEHAAGNPMLLVGCLGLPVVSDRLIDGSRPSSSRPSAYRWSASATKALIAARCGTRDS
jgi:hypothetical protein